MRIRPSIGLGSLPAGSYAKRFAVAAAAGFEGVEIECSPGDVAAVGDAAAETGLVVHSTYTGTNWRYPLSSGNEARLAVGIRATISAIETAHALGAETLLLIPAVVDRATSYSEAYARSQAVIRKEILPVARQLGVTIAVENVWNGLLLGPLEYIRYIDEFESPWVRACLDLGNIIFGQSEDWIDIAGSRTVKLHLKDFRFDRRWGRFRSRRIGEGELDWTRIRLALARIDFAGWGTVAGAERTGRMTHLVYYAAERAPPRLLASIPGSRRTLAAAQSYLGRRMLADAIGRFRHHLA